MKYKNPYLRSKQLRISCRKVAGSLQYYCHIWDKWRDDQEFRFCNFYKSYTNLLKNQKDC